MILSSADEQLEDGTMESLDKSKEETDASSSPDVNNSIAEATEQDGTDKAEVDAKSAGKMVSQNGTDGKEETVKDDTSEVTAKSIPVVGDEDSVKTVKVPFKPHLTVKAERDSPESLGKCQIAREK